MTHQQILDKLAAKSLVQSIDEDLARLTIKTMSQAKHDKKIADNMISHILPIMLLRWDCALKANNSEVTSNYKQKTILALGIILHKYGFVDNTITEQAIKAIDQLNKEVALSDDFFRKSVEIKAFLKTKPTPLKRSPNSPDNITFYRAKDVISIQLNKKYYCAYIHSLISSNESPIIEFYEKIFDIVPTILDLENSKAKGQIYNDGIERITKFSVSGIKFLPDLANQIQLIGSTIELPPSNTHLTTPDWQFTVSDIFNIQDDIKRTFEK
jgi:hypothetical protein